MDITTVNFERVKGSEIDKFVSLMEKEFLSISYINPITDLGQRAIKAQGIFLNQKINVKVSLDYLKKLFVRLCDKGQLSNEQILTCSRAILELDKESLQKRSESFVGTFFGLFRDLFALVCSVVTESTDTKLRDISIKIETIFKNLRFQKLADVDFKASRLVEYNERIHSPTFSGINIVFKSLPK